MNDSPNSNEPFRPELPLEMLPTAENVGDSTPARANPPESQGWWKPFRAKHPISWIPTVVLPFVLIPASIVVSIVVIVVLILVKSSPETLSNPDLVEAEIERILTEPIGFFVSIFSMQLTMLLPVGALALLSREGVRRRLNLTLGNISLWTWPLLVLSIAAVGIGMDQITQLLGVEASDHLESLMESISTLMVSDPLLVLFSIAFLPGLCEELCYRGYIQHRLVRSWNPLFGILFASVFFAAAHLDPLHVILVFPMGLWMGIVSWRCGSIIPAILGHMLNNAFASIQTLPEVAAWSEVNGMLIALIGAVFFIVGTILVTLRPGAKEMPAVA